MEINLDTVLVVIALLIVLYLLSTIFGTKERYSMTALKDKPLLDHILVNNTQLYSERMKSKPKTLYFYTMNGCGPCNQLKASGVIDKLKQKYGNHPNYRIVHKVQGVDDVPAYVNGFPHIEIDNGGFIVPYGGDRSFRDLENYLLQEDYDEPSPVPKY